jgi:hypothetical protein
MMRTAALLLALLTASHSAAAQRCAPSDTARARKELTSFYGTFREAFMRNTPQPGIAALTPTVALTHFDGRVMPRALVEEYVRANATEVRIETLAMSVEALSRRADTVVATVEQTSDRESTDDRGIRHRLEVGVSQLETWVCTGAGWRLGGVKEDSLLYLRRDGKLNTDRGDP